MKTYKQTDLATERLCPICSSVIPESKSRPFVYCSNACKFKAFRQREKTQRILSVSEKPQRISEKSPKSSPKKKATETIIGVSGTVYKLPIVEQKPITLPSVIRTFEDLKSFF